eukprot:15359696-Ditylum_brightwellii.AAC.1
MCMAINAIAVQQANPKNNIAKDMVHLLNYCSAYPAAVLQHSSSRMILHIHSNASYLSEPEAHSSAGGHFFLSIASSKTSQPPTEPVPLNGPIHM